MKDEKEKGKLMKKKQFVKRITFIVALALVCAGIVFTRGVLKREEEKRAHEDAVAHTKEKFDFYLEKTVLDDCDDDIRSAFNEVNIESSKNERIAFDDFVKKIFTDEKLDKDGITKLENLIDEEMNEYSSEKLAALKRTFEGFDLSGFDLETLEDIYESHEFIQNLEDEQLKREEYLGSLSSLKGELEYFSSNKGKYYLKNGEYVCKDDGVLTKIQAFGKKYGLNMKASKEVIVPTYATHKIVKILCYHGILDEPWGIQNLFVKRADFEAQMKYLSENGYTPLFASEIANASNYSKPIIITFDDGYRDVYTNAFPVLKRYNMKANVYMISGWIGGSVYMTADMTKEMSDSPLIEIGSHTVSHKSLATLSNTDIEYELSESKKTLEAMTGKPIDVIAYPTGSFDSRVIDISSKYYKYALSTINGVEYPGNLNRYTLKRMYVNRGYTLDQFKALVR